MNPTGLARCGARLLDLYVLCPPQARLDDFSRNILGMNKTCPKMKCYGKECQGLVPVLQAMVRERLNEADPVQQTVLQATESLALCYTYARQRTDEASEGLRAQCRRFCTLWVALERLDATAWHCKPKMHMFQELCEMDEAGCPTAHSTYRDEEFGGSVVALGKRRGGHSTPKSVGMLTLAKFCSKHRVPRL